MPCLYYMAQKCVTKRIFFIRPRVAPKARRERDSSGTTERVKPAKVMERIARRKPRRGAAARPNAYFIVGGG
jgi:hypothetical protein